MGNKHSADITNPCIQSYTQHPDGVTWAGSAPRRNSFNGGIPTDNNNERVDRKKLAASKSLYVERDNERNSINFDRGQMDNGRSRQQQQQQQHHHHHHHHQHHHPQTHIKEEIRSRPGTNDSGYFTTCLTDSDKSERARLRGSRTSLNEAVFAVPPPPPSLMRCGPPPSPGFLPPNDPLMVGVFGPPPQAPPPPPPPLPLSHAECKKMKKWRKKQQKILSRHESLMNTLDPRMPPPFGLLPHPPPPPPPGSFLMYRARSVDNLHMAAAVGPPFLGPAPLLPPPPPSMIAPSGRRNPRRFASQTDLRFLNGVPPPPPQPAFCFPPAPLSPPPPPVALLEGKYDKRGRKLKESKKDGSVKGSSLLGSKPPSSRSGRTSRNNDDTNTKFEEERIIKPNESKLSLKVSKDNDFDLNDVSSTKSPPPDVIYETLKATRQQRSTLLTTADIEFENKRETKENVLNISFEKPVEAAPKKREDIQLPEEQQSLSISPEARAVIQRNEELLADAEKRKDTDPIRKVSLDNEEQKTEMTKPNLLQKLDDKNPSDKQATLKREDPASATISSDSGSNSSSSSKGDSSKSDSMIEAVLNPILLKRKTAKPEGFEALQAWRDIKVDAEVPDKSLANTGYYVPENIVVKLVAVAPSKKDQQHTEPIYLEYDERLPDFKKRLIETGSFDFPEIEQFHQRSASQYSEPKAVTKDDDIGTTLENACSNRGRKITNNNNNNNNEGKGSLKRLKDSVAQMFGGTGTRTNDKSYSPNDPSNNNNINGRCQERSLTPTTAKIKAGDSSEIDFSWVHDLETRFRREREQFEREMESRKRQTLTQRNAPASVSRSQGSDNNCLRSTYASNGYVNGHETLNGHIPCDLHGRTFLDNDFASLQRSASNNVRAKTAMFESEAQRLQNEMDLKRQQMSRQKRSSSTPVRSGEYIDEEPIYIPKPDYDYSNGTMIEHNRTTLPSSSMNGCCPSNRVPVGNCLRPEYHTGNGFDSRHSQQHSYDLSNPRRLNRFYNGDHNEASSIAANNRGPFDQGTTGMMNGFSKTTQYHHMMNGKSCREFGGLPESSSRPINGLSRMNGYENGFAKSDVNNFSSHYVSQPSLDCNADIANGTSDGFYRQNFIRRLP